MTWSCIDIVNVLESESWFRACLWAETNKFVIFGNCNGNLVKDYNHRLLSWDHVAMIDLESFGIYQPLLLWIDVSMQEYGLPVLKEALLTDFEVICDDGHKIKCSRFQKAGGQGCNALQLLQPPNPADLVTNSAVYMLTIARGGGGSQNLDQGDSEYQGHPNDALELPNHPQGMFTVRLPGTADQQSMTLDSKGHVGSQITAEAPQQISDKIGPVMLHSKTKAIQS
ncbi:hypothetical protein EV401DRAFT_2146242 [Pisolithus croceorrhizus]|nr:hypothetical protein EV401DRAFT_2146242 [Pisolithus croceorrhizus]